MIAPNTAMRPPGMAPTDTRPATDTLRIPQPTNVSPVEYASQIVQQVLQRHDDATFAKQHYHGEWLLNMAFYCNRQWVNYDSAKKCLMDVANPLDGIRETSNLIRPYSDSVMALLASGKPEIEVVPATHQVEDEQSAEVSDACLDYVDQVTGWPDLKNTRDGFRVVFGTTAIRYDINPEPVRVLTLPIPNPRTGAPTTELPEYELQGFCYDPQDFDMFPINLTSHRDIRGVGFNNFIPVEEAREKWPMDATGKKITIEPDVDLRPNEYYKQRREMLFTPSTGKAMRGMVRVHEQLWLPTKAKPAGCKYVVVNKHLVGSFDNPYIGLFRPESPNFLKLGVVFYRGLQVPGRPYGVGIPEDLRQLQVSHNKMKTQEARNRVACGNVKIAYDSQRVDKNQVTNDDACMIPVPGMRGGAPFQVIAPQLLNLSQPVQQLRQDMDFIGRRPPITAGFNQPQVRSGTQTSQLQQSGDQVFTLISQDTEEGDKYVAILKLALAKRYYSPLKITRIMGDSKGYAPSVIANCDIYTDVRVVPGSGLPKNRALWNALLMDAWQKGVIVDQNGAPDYSWLRQNLNLGGKTLEDRYKVDRDHAQTENVQMAQTGQPALVNPWDNDVVEIEQHELDLKKNPNQPMQVVQAKMLHIQWHAQKLVGMLIQPATPAMEGEDGSGAMAAPAPMGNGQQATLPQRPAQPPMMVGAGQ